jgi:hypothetical protein
MLGEDLPTNSWPTCGEIDIMENARNWGPAPNNHNSASLHYPGRFGGNPELALRKKRQFPELYQTLLVHSPELQYLSKELKLVLKQILTENTL